MKLSISQWASKNKQDQTAASMPSCPFDSHWPLLRVLVHWANYNAFNQLLSLSLSTHFPLLPPTLLFSSTVCSFTWLLLSCHHSHLNPVRRGPDRADWFPVRRCLEHILELSERVHPSLLHSNLRGRPCLLLRLCCRHVHVPRYAHTKYIKAYEESHIHRHMEPTGQ